MYVENIMRRRFHKGLAFYEIMQPFTVTALHEIMRIVNYVYFIAAAENGVKI